MIQRKLLIQALYSASTNDYSKYFPQPLILLKYYNPKNDRIIDLNLAGFGKKREEKYKIIDRFVETLKKHKSQYTEIIINCGEYAPDGAFHKFFDYFLGKLNIPIKITGSYPAVFSQRISEKYQNIEILNNDFDVRKIEIPYWLLVKYPKVNDALKVNLKITNGCPHTCTMCPVQIIHKSKYKFLSLEESIKQIKRYYAQGIRFFNFIDDNISATPIFKSILVELVSLNLKGAVFLVQEGFEITAFNDRSLCKIIKELNFVDIKLGMENINEQFLTSINKYYTNRDIITKSIQNLKDFGIDFKVYLLLGLAQTEEDILENIKFVAQNYLAIRANIVRDYSTKGNTNTLSINKLKEFKSLALAISTFASTYKINPFSKNAILNIKNKLNISLLKSGNLISVLGIKNNDYGVHSLTKVIKYTLELHLNIKLFKINQKENIIFQILSH